MNDLTDLEYRLREILEAIHRGKDNALPRVELCNIFPGVNERQLRMTIKHLIIKHECPIGSCPQGYFWAETQKEIDGVCAYFKGYALSQLQVVSKLKKISLAEVCGQLALNDLVLKEPQ